MRYVNALIALLLAGAVFCFVMAGITAFDRPSSPTPTHVAAVFFDGYTHGDLRQTCHVWQQGRTHQAQCVAYLALLIASSGTGDYRVLPHSYKGWREGSTEVASVRVFNAASTQMLTVRLVKTAHGWLVVSVRG